MRDPYETYGPTVISVSGGRTSAYMLRQVLDSYDGGLPPDCAAVFCNTGLEHEATLQFLHEIESRWCPLVWLEYCRTNGKQDFRVVDYCRASRNGEPFGELIDYKKMLPNPVTRFCSSELKIRTCLRYVDRALGWSEHDSFIGIRYDEPKRWGISGERKSEFVRTPLVEAKVCREDVQEFWNKQNFDLQLPGGSDAFGNCNLCFLKGRKKLELVMQSSPQLAKWWIKQEGKRDSWFRNDRPTYRQMLHQIGEQGVLFDSSIDDDTMPCACTD